jgi:Fe-Mn family superoxide dismutase
MPHQLPNLPYDYGALEPVIDETTMRVHHDKHHAKYVNKLNDTLEGTQWLEVGVEELLVHLDELPVGLRDGVRKFGGGHFNHSLFWRNMTSPDQAREPEGSLRDALEACFGSVDECKSALRKEALGRFGSGWAWLCVKPHGDLHCLSTPNQDPCFIPESTGGLGHGHTPILGIDVWEHAYYLKYQNERAKYVDAWWDVVNWGVVSENFERALRTQSVLAES